jgi:hypothetical protein
MCFQFHSILIEFWFICICRERILRKRPANGKIVVETFLPIEAGISPFICRSIFVTHAAAVVQCCSIVSNNLFWIFLTISGKWFMRDFVKYNFWWIDGLMCDLKTAQKPFEISAPNAWSIKHSVTLFGD